MNSFLLILFTLYTAIRSSSNEAPQKPLRSFYEQRENEAIKALNGKISEIYITAFDGIDMLIKYDFKNNLKAQEVLEKIKNRMLLKFFDLKPKTIYARLDSLVASIPTNKCTEPIIERLKELRQETVQQNVRYLVIAKYKLRYLKGIEIGRSTLHDDDLCQTLFLSWVSDHSSNLAGIDGKPFDLHEYLKAHRAYVNSMKQAKADGITEEAKKGKERIQASYCTIC